VAAILPTTHADFPRDNSAPKAQETAGETGIFSMPTIAVKETPVQIEGSLRAASPEPVFEEITDFDRKRDPVVYRRRRIVPEGLEKQRREGALVVFDKKKLDRGAIYTQGAISRIEMNDTLSHTVILSNKHIEENHVRALAQTMQSTDIVQKMHLNNCQITESTWGVFCEELISTNKSVTHLWMDHNKIELSSWLEIEEKTEFKKAKKEDRKITYESIFLNAMVRNISLRYIFLNNNCIDDEGAYVMADCIVNKSALVGLWLNNNQITDKGGIQIAKALNESCHRNLVEIHLSGNIAIGIYMLSAFSFYFSWVTFFSWCFVKVT
jgi:hypothetical protein